jgi:glycosyltransferase involved in cell wall biosynthesis
MRLAIAGRRHGPYHHARFGAAARRCDLTAVEFSRTDKVNGWDYIATPSGFRQVTLFTDDVDIDDHAPPEIRRAVRRALDQIDPAVVAVPGWSHPGALACLDWCLRRGRPAVLMSDSTAHDQPRVWWREALKRRVVRLFHAALVAGSSHRAYARALGLLDDAIFEGYDAVDNAHFADGAARAREGAADLRRTYALPRRFFLAAGRFIQEKNLTRLIEAYELYWRNAGTEPWSLVLLGDGELRATLEDRVHELRLQQHVLMPGLRQYDELPTYYGLADALVHASTSDAWGLVVNEAMASGLPVLVSDRCGCAPDLVEHGVNGFTFDPYDFAALAGLMQRIAAMADEQRHAMAAAGQRIIAAWGLERSADGLMRAVEAALRRPPSKPSWFDRSLLWALAHRP